MKIAVIGSGHIATFFSVKLAEAGHQITQVLSKHKVNALKLAERVDAHAETNPSLLHADSDVYLLAVNDDAIRHYLNHPVLKNKLVIYTSGALGLDELVQLSSKLACIWPVYSIQMDNLPMHDQVPMVITHTPAVDIETVQNICNVLSTSHYVLNDQQKRTVHLGAVIANNFTNHLFTLSEKLLQQDGISFDLLRPLIENTTDKLKTSPPYKNQSGPAIRHDQTTIQHHLDLLKEDETLKTIYLQLTESIQKYYR
jgi:predicted short-subunit dehydrogenase-like oxidoreductase (DUF2520 family)